MSAIAASLDRLAAKTLFSGVVCVDRGEDVEVLKAYGLAHRALEVPNEPDTRFAIASGGKGLTALMVMSLIEDGTLTRETRVRSVLGNDLPLIDDAVTVEHLLAHRSGIGDYLDEDAGVSVNDYAMPVPVHELDTTEQFLRVLDGHPQRFAPGERFSYCNGGYVVLALIAERATGIPYHDLVMQRVCRPAGMAETAFLRSDELPARTAIGYLANDGLKTNVFHLPVRGNGDGGIYSTVTDISALWGAVFSGRILPMEVVAEMLHPRSDVPSAKRRYGLGFWLHRSGSAVILTGSDAGVSFRSVHDPAARVTHTVISNTSEGAWPLARVLMEELTP